MLPHGLTEETGKEKKLMRQSATEGSPVLAQGADTATSAEHLPFGKCVVLHLLPGALVTAAFALLVPVGSRFGVPAFAVFLVLGVVLLVPLELGYLLWQAWKRTGTLRIATVVSYRERIPSWQYVILPVPLLLWMLLIFLLLSPTVETSIIERFFSWVPQDYHLQSFATHMEDYNRPLLIWSAVLMLIFGGIIGPVVEELYFRGYLLPRMSRCGSWAPLLHTVLFSLYHFFTPWQNPARILGLTPLYYVVWWKRNIYIGILVHCAGNTLGMGALLLAVLLG